MSRHDLHVAAQHNVASAALAGGMLQMLVGLRLVEKIPAISLKSYPQPIFIQIAYFPEMNEKGALAFPVGHF